MNLPEPYASLRIVPKHLLGWFSTSEELEKLLAALAETRPNDRRYEKKTIVEVGSWLGLSTVWFAQRADRVYAVDTWLGSMDEQNVFYEPDKQMVYPRFLSNMIHESVAHKVTPVRMTSEEAAACLEVRADLVFLDAGHDTQRVYNDAMLWAGKLVEKGALCGDDVTIPSVRIGSQMAAKDLRKEWRAAGNLWWLE